jgi:TolB-like protein/Tfp pilus assembly protein PilF
MFNVRRDALARNLDRSELPGRSDQGIVVRSRSRNGAATGKELFAIDCKPGDSISDADIRDQVSRILESSSFAQSDRLARFLRFTVETTLEGKADTLKEYVIGTAVYDRQPSYSPAEDSIVRSEARRLRRKLHEYYESTGKDDRVFIFYRLGSYVPAFRPASRQDCDTIAIPATQNQPAIAGREVRVAILPLVDLSGTQLSSECARYATDELIHALVRTDGLRVTAVSSVAPLVARGLDIPTLARKLDLQIILEGTVREDNNKIRITSTVIDADGFQIRSERFETEPDLRDVSTASKRIASTLSSRLRPESSLLKMQTISGRSPISSIYPLLLSAEAALEGGTVADVQSALCKLETIAEVEPSYARAACDIALCYCELALLGVPKSGAIVYDAKHAAERAAELDSQSVLVPTCMGGVLTLERRWGKAEKRFQRALGLGEHAETYRQYALLLVARGRFDEARNYLERAEQIDPFSGRLTMAYAKYCFLSRSYEQGVKYIPERMASGRVPIESEIYLAMMLSSLGRGDEATRFIQDRWHKTGTEPVLMSGIAEVLAMCGNTDAAVRIARDYGLFSSNSPVGKYRQALLSLALGDSEKAMILLCAAYEEREAELIWLPHDPRLEVIYADSRFARLLDQVMCEPSDELLNSDLSSSRSTKVVAMKPESCE